MFSHLPFPGRDLFFPSRLLCIFIDFISTLDFFLLFFFFSVHCTTRPTCAVCPHEKSQFKKRKKSNSERRKNERSCWPTSANSDAFTVLCVLYLLGIWQVQATLVKYLRVYSVYFHSMARCDPRSSKLETTTKHFFCMTVFNGVKPASGNICTLISTC